MMECIAGSPRCDLAMGVGTGRADGAEVERRREAGGRLHPAGDPGRWIPPAGDRNEYRQDAGRWAVDAAAAAMRILATGMGRWDDAENVGERRPRHARRVRRWPRQDGGRRP